MRHLQHFPPANDGPQVAAHRNRICLGQIVSRASRSPEACAPAHRSQPMHSPCARAGGSLAVVTPPRQHPVDHLGPNPPKAVPSFGTCPWQSEPHRGRNRHALGARTRCMHSGRRFGAHFPGTCSMHALGACTRGAHSGRSIGAHAGHRVGPRTRGRYSGSVFRQRSRLSRLGIWRSSMQRSVCVAGKLFDGSSRLPFNNDMSVRSGCPKCVPRVCALIACPELVPGGLAPSVCLGVVPFMAH